MGSATISFGLVSVPVVMYSSSESAASVSFNMLHKSCGTRLKQQYICPKDNVVVEKDDIAKGYEFAKGQYVLFSPEELKTLDEKATNTIDISPSSFRWRGGPDLPREGLLPGSRQGR